MRGLKEVGLAAALSAGAITTALPQTAMMLPPNQRVLAFYWKPVAGVSGYNFYYGSEGEPWHYDSKTKYGGPTTTNNIITIPNCVGEKVFNVTTYNSYLESDFGPEVKINFGPAPTAFLTNYNGQAFYQVSETRFQNDEYCRLMQTTQSNRFWSRVVGAIKADEHQIGTNINTYLTTWLIPTSLPAATNMFFETEWVANYLNTGKKPAATQFTEVY